MKSFLNCLKYFYKFKKKHLIILCIKLILLSSLVLIVAESNARNKMDKDESPPPGHEDPVHVRTTRRPSGRKTGTTSPKTTIKTTKPTTPKSNSKIAVPLYLSPSITPPKPFNYSSESLNQTHANMFKNWIDIKSNELYDLSMNYSGFKLLNATYNVQLRKDAKFAWINFTEMIINISKTISEVLHHKTLIVKNLSDLVEKAFDEYRNDTRRVKDSATFLYYDAKSPKTFCDVQEANILRASKQHNSSATKTTPISVKTSTISTTQQTTLKQKPNATQIKTFNKRNYGKLDDDIDLLDLLNDELFFDYKNDKTLEKLKSYVFNETIECPYHYRVKRQIPTKETPAAARGKNSKKPGQTKRPRLNYTTSRGTTTTTATPVTNYLYDDADERTDLETYDYMALDYDLSEKSPYWNISCINRTFDENFKNFQKGVNRNQSTLHVPTNVYKQDLDINMTAYWTEALDDLFKLNYDNDNELFWQYFCSSNGLFRRFPGAYWTVPQNEDFFDCRLQSWYIMAAASPKDVLILLDVSGSMTGLRLEIAKKLVEAIMDTLSDNDFFNILTFSNTVDYLMNKENETQYRERFIQAGRTNKKVFVDRLKWFKNTSNIADFETAFKKSFDILLKPDLDSDSCNCNKAIMLLTDGATENAENVFRANNWENGRKVRVFTFLIGREVTDSRQVEWMACANDGQYFHVATLADVNEHVHEYIPVLSRPMALTGQHETTWSNVFVGHLDKELKIAVARPAFKTKESLLSKVDLAKKDDEYFRNILRTKSSTQSPTTTEILEYDPEYEYYEDDPVDEEVNAKDYEKPEATKPEEKEPEELDESNESEEINILKNTNDVLRNQQVLLGVVGVDVPVLRLISKVSPKYQMGVGIYIIMLDNNGFIVFHPSIKKEIARNDFNFKGTSNSIDLDRFEIPIGNDEEFENLEHEMIDQKTGNMTLDNWKREGLRVIRRRTEYVYTPVSKTPFSVAIASPSSFGRYYIDLPSNKENDYEFELKDLIGNNFESNIQLYNCSYNYTRLIEKILNPKQYMDYCIRYLFQDRDQVLAIKSDLVFHNLYYQKYNLSMYAEYPNLVKSSFYGTYSGITFFLPVMFYRSRMGLTVSQLLNNNYSFKNKTKYMSSTTFQSQIPEPTRITQPFQTEPQTEMTMNVELGSILEPLLKASTKPNTNFTTNTTNTTESEIYKNSLNLLSTESNKHTYSFEKQYYTRSIEFSDYLRTEFNMTEPVVNYFLNESSKEIRRDTVGATIPIWLDKVPTAVTGVMYDAQLLQYFLFENYMMPDCDHITCRNLCSQKRGMNLSCYLVDEHGIVVLSTQERVSKQIKEAIGQPLYKVNPWLMKILEYEGVYDLVIPGKELPECKQESRIFNNSTRLKNFLINLLKLFVSLVSQIFWSVLYIFYRPTTTNAQGISALNLAEHIRIFNNEWRGKNSHCYNFGVYAFNLTKWNSLDASEIRVWCNSTNNTQRKFLVSSVKHSNLIMLVVEEEFELIHCGNLSQLIKQYESPIEYNLTNDSLIENLTINEMTMNYVTIPIDLINDTYSNLSSAMSKKITKRDFTVNRYRKKPEHCHNIYENEKQYLPCLSKSVLIKLNLRLIFACLLMSFKSFFKN